MSFKICLIGCGGMVANLHGPAYKKYALLHPDTKLAACCDMDEQKAVFIKQEFGFSRHYTDMYTMLNKENPDVVCLIVPVNLTARLSVAIMEKGFPLILEKPPGVNCEETKWLVDTAERYRTKTCVAFNRRYMPLVREFRKALSESIDRGELQNISCDFFRINRREPDFYTTAIHGIDLIRYISGSDYSHIRFRYKELPDMGKNVANIFMDCTLKSGVTAQLSFCPVTGMINECLSASDNIRTYQLSIPTAGSFGLPGKLVCVENNKIITEISGLDLTESKEFFEIGGFYDENASFFNAIRNGRIHSGDIKSAFQSVEVAECINNRSDEYFRE